MRINGFGILVFLALVISLISCKKDTDDISPTITFTAPNENQFFNVNDVVQVKASVRDQVKITSVSIRLLDEQYNIAHESKPVTVSSPSMRVDEAYLLDNIHLESGVYFLLITASDGKNDFCAYRKIYIGAVPKVVRNVFVVGYASPSQTSSSFIDSTFNTITPYRTFPGDYVGSSVSNYYQQVYMCENYTRNFTGIKLTDNSIKFNIAPTVSTSPYFTGFYSDDKKNYIARYDGYVIGYDNKGQVVYGALAMNNYVVQRFCFNNNYMVSEEKHVISGVKSLVTHHPSGAIQQSASLNQDIVSFCEKDNDEVFLFGNSSGQGVIQLFDRTNNYIWNPYPSALPSGTILSAVKMDVNTYLIGHSNGTIYKYEYSNSSLTIYLSGYTAVQLKYDFVSNRLYVAETNSISTFDYPSGSFLKSVNTTEPVLDIHLLYNR